MSTSVLLNDASRFRALCKGNLLAVYVHDFEGHFLDANDAALDLLGFSREELPDLNFATLLDAEQLPLALASSYGRL